MVLFRQTVSGLLLQEPLQIAKGIDADTKFKALNGWLDSLILSKRLESVPMFKKKL